MSAKDRPQLDPYAAYYRIGGVIRPLDALEDASRSASDDVREEEVHLRLQDMGRFAVAEYGLLTEFINGHADPPDHPGAACAVFHVRNMLACISALYLAWNTESDYPAGGELRMEPKEYREALYEVVNMLWEWLPRSSEEAVGQWGAKAEEVAR